MDNYGYEQFASEYPLFPPLDNEDNSLSIIDPPTIDPALLQISVSNVDSAFGQQQEPAWDDQNWPTEPSGSNLGLDLRRPAHLERHVRHHAGKLDLAALHPCTECPAYQGKNGFKRPDHLKQHLRVFHKWDNDQLATLFPPRKTRILKIPVCHFPECDYYRGPGFEDMGVREREENRPFDTQSHYTDHMKREHDWSPYPCKVTGCNKVNGSGFFSATTLERHYKEKHAGCAMPTPKAQDRITGTIRCGVAEA
ncbi:hypothetical protein CIB48_g10544 [Xylaria polymorpha]|nr:hypothetical protein CIB48_g10544 [Xylaria polymorpha]